MISLRRHVDGKPGAGRSARGPITFLRANSILVLLALLALPGCGKQLTETSAVGLLQAYLDGLPHDENVGHAVVDSCDRLLLSGETGASAICRIHLKLTSAGEAGTRAFPKFAVRYGEKNFVLNNCTASAQGTGPCPSGSTSPFFSKKPNGAWVVADVQ